MKKEETKTKNESTVSTSVKRQPDETCCRGQSIEEFALPGVTDLSHLANFFKILGDRTRLKILMRTYDRKTSEFRTIGCFSPIENP